MNLFSGLSLAIILVAGTLPPPPSNNGPIRNLGFGRQRSTTANPTFYRDCAVLAYRTPIEAANMSDLQPNVTTHDGSIDATPLLDHDLNSFIIIKAPDDGSPAWLQFEYPKPVTVRAFTISGSRGVPVGRLAR